MDKGWIKLSRQIQDHWIWEDPEKLKAWLDLLMMANIKTKKSDMREGLVTIRRGQIVTSISKLADRWKWSKERVRRFLCTLERDGMVTRKRDTFKTTLTIVNYAKFQGDRHSGETSDEYADETSNEYADETRLKKDKNDKRIKEGQAANSDEQAAAQEEEEYVGMTDEEWEALGEDI